jgi:hypothetical protein
VVVSGRTRFLLGVPNFAEGGCDGAVASQCNMYWATLSYGEQLAPLICGEITVEGKNTFEAYLIGVILPKVGNGHSHP